MNKIIEELYKQLAELQLRLNLLNNQGKEIKNSELIKLSENLNGTVANYLEVIEQQDNFNVKRNIVSSPKPLGSTLIDAIKLIRGIETLSKGLETVYPEDDYSIDFENLTADMTHAFWHFQGYLNYASDVDVSGEKVFIP